MEWIVLKMSSDCRKSKYAESVLNDNWKGLMSLQYTKASLISVLCVGDVLTRVSIFQLHSCDPFASLYFNANRCMGLCKQHNVNMPFINAR